MRLYRFYSRNGLTTVEVVVGAVLVSTLLVSSLTLLGASLHTHVVVNEMLDGPMLADQLLAEIMAQSYEDPEDGSTTRGTDTGESTAARTDWDDVDDYDGLSNSPPQDRDGNSLTAFSGWTREATVVWADRDTGDEDSLSEAGEKRIEVQVTAPSAAVTTRYAFRSRWGALEQAPTVDSTIVTELESSLQVGSASDAVNWSTNLLNHVADPNAN